MIPTYDVNNLTGNLDIMSKHNENRIYDIYSVIHNLDNCKSINMVISEPKRNLKKQ